MTLKQRTMITIKNLAFQYKKKKPLFTDFSMDIENGSIVGILGKNGAGKSTLLNVITGLLFPLSGKVDVNGFTPAHRTPAFLADIYMVQEEFSFPSVSIDCYLKATVPFYPSFDMEKAERIFKEFELQRKHHLNKLSHGQRKKFLIAFALASNCKVLIFDEPTNGLDIPSKSLFRKILVSSVTEDQLVLISTHQVKDVEAIIDNVIVIDNGNMVYQERMADIDKKLHFETVPSLDEVDGLIYHERCPSGYRIIVPTISHIESNIDLELLFNAIINKSIKTE